MFLWHLSIPFPARFLISSTKITHSSAEIQQTSRLQKYWIRSYTVRLHWKVQPVFTSFNLWKQPRLYQTLWEHDWALAELSLRLLRGCCISPGLWVHRNGTRLDNRIKDTNVAVNVSIFSYLIYPKVPQFQTSKTFGSGWAKWDIK